MSTPSQVISGASMTTGERARIVQLFQDSEKEFLCCIEHVNDFQWNWKSAPECWSVGQTAEHILLAEIALFAGVQRAIQSPPDPDWERKTAGKTELLERVMPNRAGKATAPERVRPQGLSKEEVIRRFTERRQDTIRFAEETRIPLKEYIAEHPFPIFNPLNAYQWLLYIPLHNLRHNKQMAEIKARPGFPA